MKKKQKPKLSKTSEKVLMNLKDAITYFVEEGTKEADDRLLDAESKLMKRIIKLEENSRKLKCVEQGWGY